MTFDLNLPWHLTLALGPDLLLMTGAMLLTLMAAWRSESPSHQRAVGWASVVLVLATLGVVVLYWLGDRRATPGVIAVDDFRWLADIVLLVGTLLTLLFAIDYNDR